MHFFYVKSMQQHLSGKCFSVAQVTIIEDIFLESKVVQKRSLYCQQMM